MRLLNASTRKLESFFDETSTPPYAILSHTWSADEVSFQDIETPGALVKEGYAKIKFACEEALRRNLGYAWIDTCCIDKTSSAELSEAINSMYKWYSEARECYVYMADVPSGIPLDETAFENSRWFTRGWTLQELLAPKHVYFFTEDGLLFGTKESLDEQISIITRIDISYLSGDVRVHSASVSRRMSWASSRITTRTEDLAYCLLGIFDINMPLLYGEGSKSFIRLQEEIMKVSDDQTLFAWEPARRPYIMASSATYSPFASSPDCFLYSGHYIPDDLAIPQQHYFITNKGLSITLPVCEYILNGVSEFWAILACRPSTDMFELPGVSILFRGRDSCIRQPRLLFLHGRGTVNYLPLRHLNFLCQGNIENDPDDESLTNQATQESVSVVIRKIPQYTSPRTLIVLPKECWDFHTRTIHLRTDDIRVVSVCVFGGERWSIVIFPNYHYGGNCHLTVIIQQDTPAIEGILNLDQEKGSIPIRASLGHIFKAKPSGQLLLPLDIEELPLENEEVPTMTD